MKDVLEKILKYLPHYLFELGQLISGPKTFIKSLDIDSKETFNNALLFLAVSMVLATIIDTILKPASDIWIYVGALLVLTLLTVATIAFSIQVAWWIVGKKSPFHSYFIIHSYVISVATLASYFFNLLAFGLLRGLEPKLYKSIDAEWNKNPVNPDFSSLLNDKDFSDIFFNSEGGIAFIIAIIILLLFIMVWWICAWGAYRELNNSGKIRSFFAGMVFVVIGFLLAGNIIAYIKIGLLSPLYSTHG